jgi:hypothetical protein
MSIVGPIFLGVGALMLAIGVFIYLRTRRFLETAVDAQGTVVGFEENHSSEGGPTYSPVVEFTGMDGQTRKFTDSVSSSPPGFDEGEVVPVKYDPKDPGRAKINKRFRLWFVTALLSSMGALFLIIGAVLLALA